MKYVLNEETGKYICPECDKEYSIKGIGNHIWRTHGAGKNFKPAKGTIPWNSGLTKEDDVRIQQQGKTYKENLKNGSVKRYQNIENKSDYELYRYYTSFKFSLNDFPDKYDFSLIEKYGWYKAKNHGDNQNGVSRDHIISVKYGFDNNIPTWIIAHPANCQLLRHKENVSKYSKCDLTLDELMIKIKKW